MKRISCFVFCILVLFVTSCKKSEQVHETIIDKDVITNVEPEALPEDDKGEEEVVQEIVDPTKTERFPLTGLPCTPEEKLERPIAVVFNNLQKALPQLGIESADVVWETNAEGGLTRLIAIYSSLSKIETIGSIRSARDYFIDIAAIHKAILVHAGGSPMFYNEDSIRACNNIDGINMPTVPADTFWRDSVKRVERGYEHSLQTNRERLENAIKLQRYETTLAEPVSPLTFYDVQTTPDTDKTAQNVTLEHSLTSVIKFTFNIEDSKYYKETYGKPHIEESTGNTLSFDNLIVIFADQKVVDADLRLELDLVGDGEGYLFTMGKQVDIKWERTSEDGGLTLSNTDGTPLYINPGKTHITIFDRDNPHGVSVEQ